MGVKEKDIDLVIPDLDEGFDEDFSLDVLDDEDLQSLEDADLNSFGEVDTNIPYPHVRINTKEFQQFLRIAKLFSAGSGRDVVSKSISFVVEDKKLVCRVTDFDSYLSYKFDILNNENILTEHVVIPVDILQKLAKASPAQISLMKVDTDYKLRIAGGDIVLETYGVELDKFVLDNPIIDGPRIEAPELLTIVRALSPLVAAAVSPLERRIIFQKDLASASYMWAAIKVPGSFADFELKMKDINILKNILVNRDEDIQIQTSEGEFPRTILSGGNFMYSTYKSSVEAQQDVLNHMKEMEGKPSVFIDLVQLFKMVELSADLPYSVGKVGLNYSDDGLQLSIKTKKGKDSTFQLQGSSEEGTEPLDEEVVLQAKLFRVLLRSFAGTSSLKVTLTSGGVGLETDKFVAVCFVE